MVLSGKGEDVRIALKTAERVRAAAVALDYTPNLLVRTLQKGTSRTFAFFNAFRNFSDDDLYMDRLCRSIEQAVGTRGYDLLVHCAFDRTPDETYRFLNGGFVDGVMLFAPYKDDPMLAMLRRSRLRSVLINTRDPEGVLPSVKEDFAGGMEAVAEAFTSFGHRRIAAFHYGRGMRDAEERIAALGRILIRRGGHLADRWIRDVGDGLSKTLTEFMSEPSGPTAVFCATDRLAYATLREAEALGIRVPEQLSIIGYDGLPWEPTTHEMATVAVDLKELTREAVAVLLDPPLEREVTIPCRFSPGTTLTHALN